MASKKPKKAKVEEMPMATLVEAGPNGLTASYASVQHLVDAGYAEINPGYGDGGIDADGNCQVRASEGGLRSLEAEAAAPVSLFAESDAAEPAKEPETQTKPKSTGYQISGDVPIPKVIRGGRNGSKYPFDQLGVGQSFFVPDSEGGKHGAARTMGSAVSVANKHAGEKRFVVRAVTENGTSGARVWRVEVNG